MTTLPALPGYYWRRGITLDGDLVEQVVKVGPIFDSHPKELFYWEPGDVGATYIKQEPDVEWFGPIVRAPSWAYPTHPEHEVDARA